MPQDAKMPQILGVPFAIYSRADYPAAMSALRGDGYVPMNAGHLMVARLGALQEADHIVMYNLLGRPIRTGDGVIPYGGNKYHVEPNAQALRDIGRDIGLQSTLIDGALPLSEGKIGSLKGVGRISKGDSYLVLLELAGDNEHLLKRYISDMGTRANTGSNSDGVAQVGEVYLPNIQDKFGGPVMYALSVDPVQGGNNPSAKSDFHFDRGMNEPTTLIGIKEQDAPKLTLEAIAATASR